MQIHDTIAVVLVSLLVITLGYKLTPFRVPGKRKPLLAIAPKYRKLVKTSLSDQEIESRLALCEFKPSKNVKGGKSTFIRGSVLGDFSVEVVKVKLGVERKSDGEIELLLEAAWLVAFDTGDFWTFIHELAQKIE